jgi:hypothetical protein
VAARDPDTAYDDLRDQRDDEDALALEKLGVPPDAARFNTQGRDGRNCPICLRTRSLTGDRAHRSTLTCNGGEESTFRGSGRGCATRFMLFLASDHLHQDTLVRLTPAAPAQPYVPIAERSR